MKVKWVDFSLREHEGTVADMVRWAVSGWSDDREGELERLRDDVESLSHILCLVVDRLAEADPGLLEALVKSGRFSYQFEKVDVVEGDGGRG